MPVVGLPTESLRQLVSPDLTDEKLDELLDQLGCDVEGFTTVRRLRCPACRTITERAEKDELLGACPECLTDAGDDPSGFWKMLGTARVIRMELVPSRPDLFDVGGLSRALRGLLGIEQGLVEYEVRESGLAVHVDPAMGNPESYRPHIGCAVIRGVELDDPTIRQIMKMQEDLHWALGRNRKFASIGVYDLSAIQAPFQYRPVGKDELEFVPLATTDGQALTPRRILEENPKGQGYKNLLESFEKYPLLIDSEGQVLSMPPIINSHETSLKPGKTDLFIDVTGIEPRPVAKTLNVVATSLAELMPGARIESVRIIRDNGESATPDLAAQIFSVSTEAASRLIGVPIKTDRATELLQAMRFGTTGKGDLIDVSVPAYRNDILHEVDLIEDMAIAIGIANLPQVLVPSFTRATERPERITAQRVSTTLLGLGYVEVMSLMLTNEQDLYENVRLLDPGDAVVTENPASREQSILRTALAPGLLRLLSENRSSGIARKLFEADDIVRIESGLEEPVQKLHVAAALQDRSAGFADIKSVVEAIAREIGLRLEYRPSGKGIFLDGRGAELFLEGRLVGMAGEVHPEVLENFSLTVPVAVLELELE